ncbi:HAD family hydrolase [Roseibium sp.]|uniref:HAD family hydrolase n=1 Tax=Roseibium sp. TaxID=1936156 RepID=UPI003BAF8191
MTGRAPAGVRAILFDKDGTLFSFDATWMAYCERMFDRLTGSDEALSDELAEICGYDRREGTFVPGSVIVAGSTEEVLRLWAGRLGEGGLGKVRRAHEAAVRALPLVPVAGARVALENLHRNGIFLGVATNDTEASARDQLAHAGLSELFGFVAGSDSGYGAKPGPGMAEGFGRASGISPAETAMVGDSVHDMEFARNAGLAERLAVLSGPAELKELERFATAVLPDISHLPRHHGLAEEV